MKRILLAIVVCFLGVVAVSAQENFPAVTIKSVSGKDADFAKLMSGSGDTAIIVSFWATWCVPCVTELDNINEQYKEWQAVKPFKLLAISIDDARTSQRVRPFVKGKGWVFDVYIDVNNDLKRALNINDVPHVLVIKNNRVVYQHTGYIAGNEDELFARIKAL